MLMINMRVTRMRLILNSNNRIMLKIRKIRTARLLELQELSYRMSSSSS